MSVIAVRNRGSSRSAWESFLWVRSSLRIATMLTIHTTIAIPIISAEH
jgi:hypothetical protein